MSKSVTIIGAGLGGLTTALRLSRQGYKVRVIEKNNQAGGRLNLITDGNFRFDMGPTFFSMSYEFEELARDCNITLPFEYHKVDPLYTVNLGNGKKYQMHRDIKKLADQFTGIEDGFEEKMKTYLEECKMIFDMSVDKIVKQNHNSMLGYLQTMAQTDPRLVRYLFRNFWQQVCRHFDSDDARQIISLVAFFLGETPFKTSSLYTLLSYTEFIHDGYYNVKGGMYGIVEGIVKVLKEQGTEFIFGEEITKVNQANGKIQSIESASGKTYTDECFVCNMDAALFRGKVLKRSKYSEANLDKMKWTFAPLTIYLGVNKKLKNISHHNYYLGKNFEEYASHIFVNKNSGERPYFYVNIPSVVNDNCAPEGMEALMIVCPMPDMRFKNDWSDSEKIVDDIINGFEEMSGNKIRENIVYKKVLTPVDWGEMFNLYKGSGLGLSHAMNQVGYFRPHNSDEELENIFYVGASTVPGTGLPMCVIGSKLITQRINSYYGKLLQSSTSV
ncbi:MAG: phytoene desaturase family protein [Bacteroidales bacterium]